MVTIMQASAPEETNAVPSTVLAHGGGASTYGSLTIEENTSNYIVGSGDGGGGDQTGQCWTSAMTAGGATLPRNASTCILWCAVALGALVRGRPFSYVGVGLRCLCRLFPHNMPSLRFLPCKLVRRVRLTMM